MMRVVNGKAYVVVSRTVYIDMERNYATVTLCYYVLYNSMYNSIVSLCMSVGSASVSNILSVSFFYFVVFSLKPRSHHTH